MNAQALARNAYAATTKTIKTPRAMEYEVIAKITHELKNAAVDQKANFPKLSEALHRNNQLWTTLAANVADKDNELPSQLRAQIFYLAEFSKRHSAQVFAGAAGVGPLLEINTAILRGLRNERTIK